MQEEVEVVNSIYEDCLVQWADAIYTVNIPNTSAKIRMSFHGYPSHKPLIYDAGVWHQQLVELLDTLFVPGEPVIFAFIAEAKELLEQQEQQEPVKAEEEPQAELEMPPGPWIVGDEIKDRGSTFVGRSLTVTSEAEALAQIQTLVADKKLARATHNMSAWRIIDGQMVTKNCDDDGETAAGSRMLHLLDITDAKNVVVVVSRWFGGTHLGPARFKHINSCARDALVKGGFINTA